MISEFKATEYEVVDRSAVITLARPHRGNAWTGRMHAEYRQRLAEAEADESVRTIVVTGKGNAFCVGGDSEALSGHAERGGYDDGLRGAQAQPGYGVDPRFDHQFAYHFGLTKPVIAAINGPAAGVGLVLACFADLRFARTGVKLTTAHGKLNLPAEYGLSWQLPKLVGLTHAMDLLLTSRIVLTDEAAQMGMINKLHDTNEELMSSTLDFAANLAATVSARSLAETRRQVYTDLHQDVASSVQTSLDLLNDMMGDDDYHKGINALIKKQPPNF